MGKTLSSSGEKSSVFEIEQEDINKLFEVDYPVMFEIVDGKFRIERLDHEEDTRAPTHRGASAPQSG